MRFWEDHDICDCIKTLLGCCHQGVYEWHLRGDTQEARP